MPTAVVEGQVYEKEESTQVACTKINLKFESGGEPIPTAIAHYAPTAQTTEWVDPQHEMVGEETPSPAKNDSLPTVQQDDYNNIKSRFH